jgi:hypothetical protein
MAVKALPYFSNAARYSSSVRTCLVLEIGRAGIGHDVILEVDDLLEVAGLHRQQVAETARHRLEEPDVHDRGRQVDVAHALAAHAAVRDLHAAAVADDALELRALVLAAGALVVALGSEDALAEETIALGTVGAVVDRLGLLDLAEAPGTDVVRACERDLHRAEVIDAVVDDSVMLLLWKDQGSRIKDLVGGGGRASCNVEGNKGISEEARRVVTLDPSSSILDPPLTAEPPGPPAASRAWMFMPDP